MPPPLWPGRPSTLRETEPGSDEPSLPMRGGHYTIAPGFLNERGGTDLCRQFSQESQATGESSAGLLLRLVDSISDCCVVFLCSPPHRFSRLT